MSARPLARGVLACARSGTCPGRWSLSVDDLRLMRHITLASSHFPDCSIKLNLDRSRPARLRAAFVFVAEIAERINTNRKRPAFGEPLRTLAIRHNYNPEPLCRLIRRSTLTGIGFVLRGDTATPMGCKPRLYAGETAFMTRNWSSDDGINFIRYFRLSQTKKAARVIERPSLGSSEECSAENRQARYGCLFCWLDARAQIILSSVSNACKQSVMSSRIIIPSKSHRYDLIGTCRAAASISLCRAW
jgi:hypothetical protein